MEKARSRNRAPDLYHCHRALWVLGGGANLLSLLPCANGAQHPHLTHASDFAVISVIQSSL
jgi:hypothetical protein